MCSKTDGTQNTSEISEASRDRRMRKSPKHKKNTSQVTGFGPLAPGDCQGFAGDARTRETSAGKVDVAWFLRVF